MVLALDQHKGCSQEEDLNISLDGKEINKVDGIVYLGGMVNEDGHSEVEVRCRIKQGANAWGKVEGFMLDRNILKKLKRKVMRACVTPACLYLYLSTVALSKQQQQLQVWFWVRRITTTKRVDERRMIDLRKDGMQQDS